jgi:hypothetical protein
VISPLVSGSAIGLAATAASITAVGFLAWRLYCLVARRFPPVCV